MAKFAFITTEDAAGFIRRWPDDTPCTPETSLDILGSNISFCPRSAALGGVQSRIKRAWKAFYASRYQLTSPHVSTRLKLSLCRAVILPGIIWGIAGIPAGAATLRHLNYAYLQIARLICERGRRSGEGWLSWQVRSIRNTRATIERYGNTLPSTAVLNRRYQMVHELATSTEPFKTRATAVLTYRTDEWRKRWPTSRWRTRPCQRLPGPFGGVISSFEDGAKQCRVSLRQYITEEQYKSHYIASFDVKPINARSTHDIIQMDVIYQARLAMDEFRAYE